MTVGWWMRSNSSAATLAARKIRNRSSSSGVISFNAPRDSGGVRQPPHAPGTIMVSAIRRTKREQPLPSRHAPASGLQRVMANQRYLQVSRIRYSRNLRSPGSFELCISLSTLLLGFFSAGLSHRDQDIHDNENEDDHADDPDFHADRSLRQP